MSDMDTSIKHATLVKAGDRRWIPRGFLRVFFGLILAAIVGTIIFLVLVQEGHARGFTGYRFIESLGRFLGYEEDRVPRFGLLATTAVGLALSVVYAAVTALIPKPGVMKGGILGVAAFLLWGVTMAPMANDVSDTGFFAIQAGVMAPLVMLVGAVLGCMMLGRVYDLVTTPDWWVPREFDVHESISTLVDHGHLDTEQRLVREDPKSITPLTKEK